MNQHSDHPGAPGYNQDRSHSRLLLPLRLLAQMDLERIISDDADDSWGRGAKVGNRLIEPAPVVPETPVPVPVAAPIRRAKGSVPIYDIEQIELIQERLKKGLEGRGDRADMMKKTCQELKERGPLRQLASPAKHWQKEMQALRETFPNAKTVFDYLESEFLLAHQCGQPLSFAPFGLVGSPGVGKSVLVEAICKLLRCSLYRIQVEISSHASALVGTELHWSNAGPGMLFLALAMGQQANPIIMLDELEKCPTRDDYPNMHKVLYSLLEPASARNFRDASFPGVPLDASRVRWIATANSLTSIPAAIQSRMRFFEVPPLTLEQSQKILLGMDAKLRIQLKVGDWPALSTEVVEQLALESPRRMQMLLRAAYGNAMVRSRRVVSLEDLPPKATTPVVPKDGEETNRQLEHLLTMTNLAALRALEVQRRLSMAERLWSFADTSTDTIH